LMKFAHPLPLPHRANFSTSPGGGGTNFFIDPTFLLMCALRFTSGEGVSGPICDHCALRQSTPLPHARYNLYTSLQAWTAEFKDSTSEVATYKAHSFKISYSTSSLIKISLFITIYYRLTLHHDRLRLVI
jgi:hypothetical protein